LATIRADGDVLVLVTMFFADEVRNAREEIGNLPGKVKLSPQELRMAKELVDSMSGNWKPNAYRDTYTDRVNELIKAKKNDTEFEPEEEAPSATNVVDLVEALRASVDAAKKGGRSSAATKTAKKAPARQSAAKKASKKSAAQKSAAKKSPAKKSTAKKSTAKKSAAKKSAAKKSTAKKSTAKKSTAKKSTAKKSAAKKRAA
jgi:DNA end-binding protein Ku